MSLNPFCANGWLRWRIAHWLNRRRDTCWADLAMWALGHKEFWRVWDFAPCSRWYSGVQSCRQDARSGGTCYCGKFGTQEAVDDGVVHPNIIIVTERVEPEDAPDVAVFRFRD